MGHHYHHHRHERTPSRSPPPASSRSQSNPPAKYQRSDTDLFRKASVLLISQYAPVSRLAYYNGLENGLEMALHEAPRTLDFRALRRRQGMRKEQQLLLLREEGRGGAGAGAGSSTTAASSTVGGYSARGSRSASRVGGRSRAGSWDGSAGGSGSEAFENDEEDEEEALEVDEVGVPRVLGRIRRAYRHADAEIRKGFFIPGYWSRSGAKQDLASSLSGARVEVKLWQEKVRGWWNADLIDALEEIAEKVEAEILEVMEKSGHKDYYELTNKTDTYRSMVRMEVQTADNVRKEFIRLAKLEIVENPVRLTKSMHKHFDWMDVHRVLERRR